MSDEWTCPVESQECEIRRTCTNKCGSHVWPNPTANAQTPGPQPVLIDGITAAQCLKRHQLWQQFNDIATPIGLARSPLTPAQLATACDLWSEQLRAKVAAQREADKRREASVVVDLEIEW